MTTPNGSPSQGVSRANAGSAVEDARRQAAAGSGGTVHTDQDKPMTSGDVTTQAGMQRKGEANMPASTSTFTR